jgi:hypothetical protein
MGVREELTTLSDKKKSYVRPRLTCYGSMVTFTTAGNSGASECAQEGIPPGNNRPAGGNCP